MVTPRGKYQGWPEKGRENRPLAISPDICVYLALAANLPKQSSAQHPTPPGIVASQVNLCLPETHWVFSPVSPHSLNCRLSLPSVQDSLPSSSLGVHRNSEHPRPSQREPCSGLLHLTGVKAGPHSLPYTLTYMETYSSLFIMLLPQEQGELGCTVEARRLTTQACHRAVQGLPLKCSLSTHSTGL